MHARCRVSAHEESTYLVVTTDSMALVIRPAMTLSHLAGFFLDDARVCGYDLIHDAIVIELLVALRK